MEKGEGRSKSKRKGKGKVEVNWWTEKEILATGESNCGGKCVIVASRVGLGMSKSKSEVKEMGMGKGVIDGNWRCGRLMISVILVKLL